MFLGVAVGCGPRPVTGGTTGELKAAGEPLSDIRLTVHQADGAAYRELGFGVAAGDGTFALFTPGAEGALSLQPGEYCFTLESVGAPLQIPAAYTKPATTPLKVQWQEQTGPLVLELPEMLRQVK